MNALLIVFAKEMLESLRDRRTLLTTLLLGPVFMPVMFSFMTHTIIKQVMDGADEKVTIAAINAEGIPCMGGSCGEIYLEKAFTNAAPSPREPLPNAQRLATTSLSFLVHPTLTDRDMRDTCAAVGKVLRVAARP